MIYIDTLIRNGDFSLDNRGRLIPINGADELLQRAVMRLSIKKGSFSYDEELGSELHRLKRLDTKLLDRTALGYVQDALYKMNEISVGSVECDYERERDRMNVKIELRLKDKNYLLEVLT